MSKHVLFYSTRCRFCQAFLEELSHTPYVPEFRLVSVDPSPSRPALPSWLKSVPALMVAGTSTPLVGPGPVNNWLFERKMGGGGGSKNAADLIQERNAPVRLPQYNPDMAPRPDATARQATPARMPAAISGSTPANSSMSVSSAISGNGDGPMAYHGSEMGSDSWSDNYSFLGSEINSQNGYNPIGRNFESLVPESGPSYSAANSASHSTGASAANSYAGNNPRQFAAPPPPKQSEKEKALNRDFESYLANRDQGIQAPLMRR